MSATSDYQHFNVLIVGAGLSGIGAAHYLQTECPDRDYAILEMRESMGGTWDLFRYPGIRSDSDMYTLGYAFRPWKDAKAIADGPAILQYIKDTAHEEGIDKKIRYNHKVVGLDWTSDRAEWKVKTLHPKTGKVSYFTCNFLLICSGYYNYDEGYTPNFKGIDRFKGRIVHPQKWTEDIEYADKKVIVIGSGATAVTLVPELAKAAEKVIMLQRSPTYVVSRPSEDKIANGLRRILPLKMAYGITRWKNILMGIFFFNLARKHPKMVRKSFKKGVEKALGTDYDVDTHFSPKYDPWMQRVCLVPDGDLFKAIKEGAVEVVTDHIDTFTEAGIELRSGKILEADLIITATGLQLSIMEALNIRVDGQPINPPNLYCYRGTMYSDLPNIAVFTGYTNASWTLKVDLTCQYICRLLNHMAKNNFQQCTPRLDKTTIKDEPLLNLTSGYIMRAMDKLPKQGDKKPWKLNQNYVLDVFSLKYGRLVDEVLEFR